MSQGRTIIIGDVHGCIDELHTLLEQVKVREHDRFYFVGDLIAKGPDSLAVYLLAKELNAQIVMGNHEFSVLEQHRGNLPVKESLEKTKKAFGSYWKNFIEDVASWPFFIEEHTFTLVHGGKVPNLPLMKTDPWALVTIRTWDGKGHDLQNPHNPPWFDFYADPKCIIFGHWASLRGVKRDNVIGLDTACVYGGELSAYILPDKKWVSVPAQKAYASI